MEGQIPEHLTKEMDNLNTQIEVEDQHGCGWKICKHYGKKSRNYDPIRTLDRAEIETENILVLLT